MEHHSLWAVIVGLLAVFELYSVGLMLLARRKWGIDRATVLLMAVVATPQHALAARPNGYPISNVNLRAGPDTDYPVIFTVPARAPIAILGV